MDGDLNLQMEGDRLHLGTKKAGSEKENEEEKKQAEQLSERRLCEGRQGEKHESCGWKT